MTIPAGSYYAEYTHNGKRNFISSLYYGSKQYDYFRITNEIGVCSGQVALYENGNNKITSGVLEVQADGDWTIEFKPVSGKTTTNMSGSGEIVTGLFTATASRNIIRMTHQGNRNFIVTVIKYNGTKYDYELVANEIGNYSGQRMVNLVAGQQYYVYVQADGEWSVDFGAGDALTKYVPPTVSDLSDTDSGNSSTGSITYSEVKTIKSHLDKAYSYTRKVQHFEQLV